MNLSNIYSSFNHSSFLFDRSGCSLEKNDCDNHFLRIFTIISTLTLLIPLTCIAYRTRSTLSGRLHLKKEIGKAILEPLPISDSDTDLQSSPSSTDLKKENLYPEIIFHSSDSLTYRLNEKIIALNHQNIRNDVIFYRGNAIKWNWTWDRSDLLSHVKGIRIKDIEHFIFDAGLKPYLILLCKGRKNKNRNNDLKSKERKGEDLEESEELKESGESSGCMNNAPEVLEYIRSRGVEVYNCTTEELVKKYAQFTKEEKNLVAFIHLTCKG